ncbi:hypothetical protein [Streptomyces sp. NPDC015680]|uniref:hypothetical protein n=1 Tax=Streptomyces sp. NPDC015680 TaxID=3364962 RepID=UPI0036FF107C
MDQEVRCYSYWGEVPTGTYMTKSQLQRLTLPRQPGGPVRATVEGRDGAGRRGTFDLYLVTESEPTSATAAQLAAAAARRTTADRMCDECGARPDRPCTPWGDTGRPLCQTCAHIERLRTAQRQATERRAHVQREAAELLDQDLAVLHVTYTDRGTTPSGRRRPPSAAHVTALAPTGETLIDTRPRLVPPRSKGIPDETVDPELAAEEIRTALDGKTVVAWSGHVLTDLSTALRDLKISWPVPTGYGRRHDLFQMTLAWRGDIDPKTGKPRVPIAPDRADRMLHLLHEMAGATGQARPAPNQGAPA